MRILPPKQSLAAMILLLCAPFCAFTQSSNDTVTKPFHLQDLVTGFQLRTDERNQFLQYVGDNFGKKKMESMGKNLSLLSADPFMIKEDVWSKLNGFSTLKNSIQLPSLNNGKFFSGKFDHVSVDFLHSSPVYAGDIAFMRVNSDNSIQLLGIPFQIDIMNLTNGFSDFAQGSLGKLSFQREEYLSQLKGQLQKAYSLDEYLSKEYDVLGYLKTQYESGLKDKLTGIGSDILPDAHAFVYSRMKTEELLSLTENQIRDKLLEPEQRKAMEEKLEANITYLEENKNKLSDSERVSLGENILSTQQYLHALDKIQYQLVESQKKSSKSSLDPQKINLLQSRLKTNSLEELKNPQKLTRLSNDLLPMNTLQRFFSKVKKMNIGTFGEESEDKMIQTLMSKAASMSLTSKNNTYTAGTGTMRDIGYLQHTGQQSSQFVPMGNMQHFSLFKNTEDKRSSSVITLANMNVKTLQQPFLQDAAFNRNVFVGSISKQIPVREAGVLTAEFSKSSSQFHNQVNSAGEAVEQKAAIQTIGADFFSTMSIGLRYTDQWSKSGITHNAYLAYSGQAYNNPANASVGRGALMTDIQLKKDFNKRKGYITTRYSSRGYNTNAETGADFRNTAYSLGGKYSLNKTLRVGGRLDLNQMNRLEDAGKHKAYQTLKLTADVNVTNNIAGVKVNNTAIVSIQNYKNNSFQHTLNSRLLLINYYGLVPVGMNSFVLSLSWNKELAQEFFISDMITSETSYQYDIASKIQLSSGLTYLDSKGYAQQIGIRQSINLNYWKNISIQAFVDARKDLKTPSMSYLYSNFRGNLSIIYSFKSNR